MQIPFWGVEQGARPVFATQLMFVSGASQNLHGEANSILKAITSNPRNDFTLQIVGENIAVLEEMWDTEPIFEKTKIKLLFSRGCFKLTSKMILNV